MFTYRLKPWMYAGIATVIAFLAKFVGGALASVTIFKIKIFAFLAFPFSLLGKLAFPLLIATLGLLAFSFFQKKTKTSKEEQAVDNNTNSTNNNSIVINTGVTEKPVSHLREMDEFKG